MKTRECLYIICIGLILALSSCGRDRSVGTNTLAQADSLIAEGQFATALELLEQLRTNPKATSTEVRQAIEAKGKVRLREAEAELLRLDSVLRELEGQIRASLNSFVVTGQGHNPNYCHKRLLPEDLNTQPHLRAVVDSLGELQLTSVYVGSQVIGHSALRLSTKARGDEATTLALPHDAALNYRYFDSERHWELVTYTKEHLDPLLPILRELPEWGLRIDLLASGRSVAGWVGDTGTIAALRETMNLRELLLERQRLRQVQTKYAQRFVRLEQKG
ncbi:MAG: hypothetical protein Q4A61_01405 [Porphyromonadaceae bacterium]|nr:hypothetical protein [Porphyromonadaceae bacterium]